MTMEEAGKAYGIPMHVLREYERWGLCGEEEKAMGAWRCDAADVERLSLILTLHEVGFSDEQIERYMRLLVSDMDSAQERLSMLREKRGSLLSEIHIRQQQLDRLDYLRFELAKNSKDK